MSAPYAVAVAIEAALNRVGYHLVILSGRPSRPPHTISVRGQSFTIDASVGVNPEVHRIVAALSGEDAAALVMSGGALPVYEVSFIATDDADVDDDGRPIPVRFSRLWPAVSAERAREEAERWGAGDGCGEVTDVGETMPLSTAEVP